MTNDINDDMVTKDGSESGDRSLLFRIWKKVTTKKNDDEGDKEYTENNIINKVLDEGKVIEEEKKHVFFYKVYKLANENKNEKLSEPEKKFGFTDYDAKEYLPEKATEVITEEESYAEARAREKFYSSIYSKDIPEEDQNDFVKQLENSSESLYEKLTARPSLLKPTDAVIKNYLSRDRLIEMMLILPPFYGGEEISEEHINKNIVSEGITFGINEELLADILKKPQYFKIYVIAKGIPPIDGIDGYVIDHFSRSSEVRLDQDKDGLVDFKNLNLIASVSKGEKICDIVKMIKPISGTTVRGGVATGKPGKEATAPKGNNTSLSADGLVLTADIDGHITFENSRFRVENMLKIKGDVDISVGNIKAVGDIHIMGDVHSGFEISAAGNIMVDGLVEGAIVTAGGNITIQKGINGNGKGILEARGNVICKYIENCTIRSGGDINSESIIGSDIYCDGSIVLCNKGVIIGGMLVVGKNVEAKIIGSKAARITTFVIGTTPNMIAQKDKAEMQLKVIHAEIEELTKNIIFLEEKREELTLMQQKILSDSKLKKSVALIREKKMVKDVEDIISELSDISQCRINCSVIYPPMRVTMGGIFYSVQNIEYRCSIYTLNGEIVLGYS